MKAVVLVGGEGTRLRPLTLTAPKQMLPIVGVPMIERVLGQLASHGIDEAVLSLGYLPDAFIEAYPEGRVSPPRSPAWTRRSWWSTGTCSRIST
jgi:mannose-1-phosphate guanylyltransferase